MKAFPDMNGFYLRNLKYMRVFAEAYSSFMQDPIAQIQADPLYLNPTTTNHAFHV